MVFDLQKRHYSTTPLVRHMSIEKSADVFKVMVNDVIISRIPCPPGGLVGNVSACKS